MTQEANQPAVESAATYFARGVDRCYRCDYDLRGIFDRQPCPECGLPAGRSRQPNDDIRFSHPKELRSLSIGVWLLLIALALTILPSLAIITIKSSQTGSDFIARTGDQLPAFLAKQLGPGPLVEFIIAAGDLFVLDIAAVIFILGIFVITRRDSASTKLATDYPLLRVALRLFSFIPLIAVLIQTLIEDAEHRGGPFAFVDWGTIITLSLLNTYFVAIGSSPLPILLMLRLRSLAHRTRSDHLTEHCAIVGCGTSASLIFFVAVFFVMNHPSQLGLPSYWTSSSGLSLLLQLLSGVSIAMFGLWSVYLQACFAIRFLAVARERSRSWAQ